VSAQDQDVPEPTVRLRLALALLRILAGRRGHASVRWHGAGFTYTLHATREPGDDTAVEFDWDGAAPGAAEALDELRDRLRTQP
jgi:hypothetical protein